MPCKYCGEKDESKLIMSSKLIDGKVVHIDLCLRCFWIDRFKAENGILSERKLCKRILSGRKAEDIERCLQEF